MIEKSKQELEQLLHEAMENIVIKAAEGCEPLSVDGYKDHLQSLRKRYRPGLRAHMSFYHLDIQNEDIKSKFVDFISVQFKDFINKKRLNVIQPASYGIGNGGSSSGQPVQEL